MAIPLRELTIDGIERTFQSNHLGHFALTSVLIPYFNKDTTGGSGTRIITVLSTASNIVGLTGLDMANLNGKISYSAWGSYGTSKLANLLFTRELQRRASDANMDWLTALTLHPGVVDTDLWRYVVGGREERLDEVENNPSLSTLLSVVAQVVPFTKTPEQGASTQIYLAAADGNDKNNNIVKGAYFEEMMVRTSKIQG